MNLHHTVCTVRLDAALPDWIALLPAGPRIEGADGRAWQLDDPAALIATFHQRQTPLVIDWEHASELRAPQGLDAPAAGWIHQLEARDGQLWGKVEWTSRAVQQIQDKEYRYLSPAFRYDPATQQIIALLSVALTNRPNLTLPALNHQEPPMTAPLLPNALCQALNLPDTADEAQALNAIHALKTQVTTPPLEKFIPRADYETVLARALNAEQQLAEGEHAQRQAQIQQLIERGLQERKISPATTDYYTAMCGYEGGLDQFKAFLDKAPPLISEPAKPPTTAAAATALNRAAFAALDPKAQRDHVLQGGRVTD